MTELTTKNYLDADHARIVAENARELERIDFERAFDSVYDGLVSTAAVAVEIHTAYIDGDPIAVFGLMNEPSGLYHHPWLVLTEAATAHPFTVVRSAKDFVTRWRRKYGLLVNAVPVEDDDAVKLLEFCGFDVRRDQVIEQHGHDYFPFFL